MRVVLDSNEFLFALISKNESTLDLFELLDDPLFLVLIPSIVLDEVTERLKQLAGKDFASGIREDILNSKISVVDIKPMPQRLIAKYVKIGLKKEDASIAAFVEWQRSDYLISENRHFLKELKTDKFKTLTARDFLREFKR